MSDHQPLVSIIIPCKSINKYVLECIESCKQLDYKNFEIILLPDVYKGNNLKNVKVIPTGPKTPGAKRNIGTRHAKGEILAFIDSDARPQREWLKNAVKYLNSPDIAAVGGPGLTPSDDTLLQKASGYVYELTSIANLSTRYKTAKARYSDDIHSCNFIVKKSILEKVGGWNEKYWPGEDTLLCQAISQAGWKMLEASDVIVYHHRRPVLIPHLKQVTQYALHRGFFAKKFKGNSLKPVYFIPSLIIITIIMGLLLSFVNPFFRILFLLSFSSYLFLLFILAVIKVKEKKIVPLVWITTVITHLAYGIYFLYGLVIKRELKR